MQPKTAHVVESPKNLAITRVALTQFRNYESVRLQCDAGKPVVLTGANGAGKTNFLEAISLLTPGRGLRGAKIDAFLHKGYSDGYWGVAADMACGLQNFSLGTGLAPERNKRAVRIDGRSEKSQASLSRYAALVWLTPQMDGIFADSTSARRKFLDRLVFGFDPAHSGRVNRYENALRQRAKILRETENPDADWLTSLESNMAETGVAIAAARSGFVENLQNARGPQNTEFPAAAFAVTGWLEDRLDKMPALALEESLAAQLKKSRSRDALTGGSAIGPHRSDFVVHHVDKAMPAELCSTGEQKALLITTILSYATLIRAERGFAPLLLLDEIAAHLDESRRENLFALLLNSGSQFWLTGTEDTLFASLRDTAQLMRVEGNRII